MSEQPPPNPSAAKPSLLAQAAQAPQPAIVAAAQPLPAPGRSAELPS